MADGEQRGCNLCRPERQAALDAGLREPLRPDPLPAQFRGRAEAPSDYLCPACSSRARARTLASVISQARAFLPVEGRALLIAGVRHEQRLLRKRFAAVDHVALTGDQGDPDCIVGTDLRAMPDVGSDAYDAVVASAVLDYVPELAAAFAEIKRVLKPGGVFLFHIAPGRLVDDPKATVKVREAAAGGEDAMPTCVFGRGHVAATAEAAGLAITSHELRDPLSELTMTWWTARKPL